MKIKQLIWINGRAETPFGVVEVIYSGLNNAWFFDTPVVVSDYYDTEAEAKAAAQADFERRARECFEENDDGKD